MDTKNLSGVVTALLSVLVLIFNHYGMTPLAAFVSDPATAGTLTLAIGCVLTLVAGAAKGIADGKDSK